MAGDLRANKAGLLQHGYASEAAVTALIAATPTAIWDVLRRPGSTRPEEAERENAFVAPGTGPGSGEVHIALIRDQETGELSLGGLVIDDERPPHFIRFVSLDPPPIARTLSEISLVQRDAGVEVRYAIAVYFDPGDPVKEVGNSEQARHSFILGQLHGVGQTLNATVTPLKTTVGYQPNFGR